MEIIELDPRSLKPYKKNPRLNDQAVPAVIESIKKFGFRSPILIDKDGVVIAGHTRLKAALSLGLQKVPCIRLEDMTPEQVKGYRIADNSTSDLAGWDFDTLFDELDSLDYEWETLGLELDRGTPVALADDYSFVPTLSNPPQAPQTPQNGVESVGVGQEASPGSENTGSEPTVVKNTAPQVMVQRATYRCPKCGFEFYV